MTRSAGADDAADGDAFWRFSLALYARPGVAGSLLALQDRGGHDVNLILFALWLGVRGLRLHAAELVAAKAAIATVNTRAVAPLRRLRRRLTVSAETDAGLAALRRRVLALELAAERRVQYRLAARLHSGVFAVIDRGDRLAVAAANLAVCLGDAADGAEARALCQALAALTRLG